MQHKAGREEPSVVGKNLIAFTAVGRQAKRTGGV